jgi:hypothetical protein
VSHRARTLETISYFNVSRNYTRSTYRSQPRTPPILPAPPTPRRWLEVPPPPPPPHNTRVWLHQQLTPWLARVAGCRWTDQQPLFLDRHPRAFEGVARFYRTRGRALERPWKVARTTWGCELRFFRLWGLGDKAEQAEAAALAAKTAGRPVKPGLRQGLWDLLEDPSSSTASKVTTFVSVAVIVASVFSMSSETVFPVTSAEAQEYHAAQKEWQRTRTQWEVAQTAWNHSGDASGSFAGWSGGPMPEDVPETQGWERTEAACIAYFTLEFVLRFYVTTEKYKFMKGPLNLVDLVAILPFYIGLLLPGGVEGVSVVRVVRLVRVFRVFKIGAHVRGLEVFRRTFLTSIHELALLLFFVSRRATPAEAPSQPPTPVHHHHQQQQRHGCWVSEVCCARHGGR